MIASQNERLAKPACHAERQWRWCAAAARGSAAPDAAKRVMKARTASTLRHESPFMFVLPVIPFPAINPVLISIGPLAVRWYALAYIVGILAGWLYARAIIASERLWGGPAPFTVLDFDDFRDLDHARHYSRRPHRLRAVLQSAAFRRASPRDFPALERRHVVPWRRRRLHRRHRRCSRGAGTSRCCRSAM